MNSSRSHLRSALLGCSLLSLVSWGHAQEGAEASSAPPTPKEDAPSEADQWSTQFTNQSAVIYNGDNRDSVSGDVSRFTINDWGLAADRLDAQASRDKLVLSLRLDGYFFYTRPNPVQVGLDMVEFRNSEGGAEPGAPSDPEFFRQKVFEAGNDLSNRYINWLVPTKYSASYNGDLAQATVGDFYGQFGRGFVLSVRKQDALASDTTIRGARVASSTKIGKTRIKATLLAGSGNPLRVDQASGRYLGVDSSVTKGFQVVTEAAMPRAIDTDYAPKTDDCITTATCSYAPDNLYGAQIEIAPKGMKFSTQGSLLTRHTLLSYDAVRAATHILTASQSIELNHLVDFGALYFEGAGQQRGYEDAENLGGYALYANLELYGGPFQLLFEGKHYRAFYPLSAGTSTARAPAFNQVRYSHVPTTEAIWNTSQFENFNTCTSGARTKLDAHVNEKASVYTWVGRYDTWAESVGNETCITEKDKRNQVWDLAVGTELTSRDRLSRTNLSFGVRDDTTARELTTPRGPTHIFYREAYTRYDALFHLHGPFSLQFQGWHRYRHQTVGGPLNPWFSGNTINALEIAPFGNIALGVEYDSNPLTPATYFNGRVTYRISSDSNVSIFAGQRRGQQQCVAGVCRFFPSFEGARLDLTLRL